MRPLSVKPPVGTVQPTARPKPKPALPASDEKEAGPSKAPSCSPQAARLAKRYTLSCNIKVVFDDNQVFLIYTNSKSIYVKH